MASSIVITLKCEDSQAAMEQRLYQDTTIPENVALELSDFFSRCRSGNDAAVIKIQSGSAAPVAASGTFTLATAVATDVVVVGPTTFTGTDTPSTNLHFNTTGTDTAKATSLAAAINAHPTVSQAVTASSAAAVVTITAKQAGVVGNFINISSPDETITASAANLAGGTGGATDAGSSYALGIS